VIGNWARWDDLQECDATIKQGRRKATLFLLQMETFLLEIPRRSVKKGCLLPYAIPGLHGEQNMI